MYNLINVYKNILQVYVMDLMVPPVWKYIIWYLLNTVRQHFTYCDSTWDISRFTPALHLYLHSRYVFADQRMSPLAYMRSQVLIKIMKESQDAKFHRWSALPEQILRIRIHVYSDILHCHLLVPEVCIIEEKMWRCIVAYYRWLFHSIICTACSCGYAMQDFAAPGRVKCMHIW